VKPKSKGAAPEAISTLNVLATRLRSKIETAVAQLREVHESANHFLNFLKNTFRSAEIVCGDKFPNFVDICDGVRVMDQSTHE
jgi:hypothetical protein